MLTHSYVLKDSEDVPSPQTLQVQAENDENHGVGAQKMDIKTPGGPLDCEYGTDTTMAV